MRFFKYLSLLFLLFSCQAHKPQKVNEKEGKVEIIIVNGTDFEKKIVFRKTDVIRKIKISPDYTTIYLHTKFCKEMNEIRYLGASFFEMKFYGSNNKLELVLGSFSKNASIRSHKKRKFNIIYDLKRNSYFPFNLIKIPNK